MRTKASENNRAVDVIVISPDSYSNSSPGEKRLVYLFKIYLFDLWLFLIKAASLDHKQTERRPNRVPAHENVGLIIINWWRNLSVFSFGTIVASNSVGSCCFGSDLHMNLDDFLLKWLICNILETRGIFKISKQDITHRLVGRLHKCPWENWIFKYTEYL